MVRKRFSGEKGKLGGKTEMSKKERNDYIRIARELGYDSYVIAKLSKAKDSTEATNIMIDARRAKD